MVHALAGAGGGLVGVRARGDALLGRTADGEVVEVLLRLEPAEIGLGVVALAVLVPQQAVSRSSTGQAQIWVVGQDGKAGPKNVELGKLVERQYLVKKIQPSL